MLVLTFLAEGRMQRVEGERHCQIQTELQQMMSRHQPRVLVLVAGACGGALRVHCWRVLRRGAWLRRMCVRECVRRGRSLHAGLTEVAPAMIWA